MQNQKRPVVPTNPPATCGSAVIARTRLLLALEREREARRSAAEALRLLDHLLTSPPTAVEARP